MQAVTGIVLGVILVAVCVLLSLLGSFLNRSRGGFVQFGPTNASQELQDDWYWPAHVLSRVLFALPTGLLVLLVGMHVRGSLVVAVMTWFSLYVGWGTYMMIGTVPTNYNSRSGIFDWLLGRQEVNWTFDPRFVREYSGMSLRGLVWTAPQGYVLQQLGFGWEYSLSGSLMGIFYYVGTKTNLTMIKSAAFHRVLDEGIPCSEVYWGWWIWFVLFMCSLAQVVRRVRVWVYCRNQRLGFEPFSKWEIIKYESLNRSLFRGAYEIFMTFFNVLLWCSLSFYSLVVQKDQRNKGQTFFGLFTAILLLTFTQGWVWSVAYQSWQTRRRTKAQRNAQQQRTRSNAGRMKTGSHYERSIPRAANLEEVEAAAAASSNSGSETTPLLSWPYSHPDRVSPTGGRYQNSHGPPPELHMQVELATTSTAFLIIWPRIERWVWMDVFILMRRVIGLVSVLSTILTVVVTVIATWWGWHSPRFMQEWEPF